MAILQASSKPPAPFLTHCHTDLSRDVTRVLYHDPAATGVILTRSSLASLAALVC